MDEPAAPSQNPRSALFQPVGPDGDWRLNAVVNRYHETDGVIAEGFESAAQLIAEAWVGGDTNDAYLMPLLLLYRHAIELNLKEAIRAVGEYVGEHGLVPDAPSAQVLDKWIKGSAGHNLAKLEGRLAEWLAVAGDQALPDDVSAAISELSKLDPGGDSFRYSTTEDKSAKTMVKTPKPAEDRVNIKALSTALADVCKTLGGVHDWAEERNQFDRDIQAEFADG